MSSRLYKYAYVLVQVPGAKFHYDMFGTDTKLTDNQCEEMRQGFNQDGGNVKSLAIVSQKGKNKGQVVASSTKANGSQPWA